MKSGFEFSVFTHRSLEWLEDPIVIEEIRKKEADGYYVLAVNMQHAECVITFARPGMKNS